jgi:hypothetical protein
MVNKVAVASGPKPGSSQLPLPSPSLPKQTQIPSTPTSTVANKKRTLSLSAATPPTKKQGQTPDHDDTPIQTAQGGITPRGVEGQDLPTPLVSPPPRGGRVATQTATHPPPDTQHPDIHTHHPQPQRTHPPPIHYTPAHQGHTYTQQPSHNQHQGHHQSQSQPRYLSNNPQHFHQHHQPTQHNQVTQHGNFTAPQHPHHRSPPPFPQNTQLQHSAFQTTHAPATHLPHNSHHPRHAPLHPTHNPHHTIHNPHNPYTQHPSFHPRLNNSQPQPQPHSQFHTNGYYHTSPTHSPVDQLGDEPSQFSSLSYVDEFGISTLGSPSLSPIGPLFDGRSFLVDDHDDQSGNLGSPSYHPLLAPHPEFFND